jgi:phosphoglycolate phosphatase
VVAPSPLSAVLLDLDGTLLDTAPDLAAALNLLREQEGLQAMPFAPIREQVSNGSLAVLRLGFPATDASRFAALMQRFLDLYRARLAVHTRPFPGFSEVLAELEAHGIPWAVITNKPAWLTEPLLRELGLFERAGCVLSGDSLAVRKPDPLPLLTAAARIGVEAQQCLYLGDALRDMQAARAADMVALGARFGYIPQHEDLTAWPVTAWIDEPRELLDWVGLGAIAR